MKNILTKLTYGHYILTARKEADELKTRDSDYIAAGTVNWASQVSFDPPMIMVAVGQKSDLNETIDYSERFTLHLLDKENSQMVENFGSDSDIKDGRINGHPFSKKDHQVILNDTAGYIECKVKKSMNIGDHTIYFGEVVSAEMQKGEADLICTMDVPSNYTEAVAEI